MAGLARRIQRVFAFGIALFANEHQAVSLYFTADLFADFLPP
jgi:hypothetical protein